MRSFRLLCLLLALPVFLFPFQFALSQTRIQLYKSTGNIWYDLGFNQEISVLKKIMRLSPDLYIYVENGTPNALATKEKLGEGNSEFGTVLFGIKLLYKENMEIQDPTGRNYSIPVILAHEFAHIGQYKYGIHEELPVKLLELHADALAGWYMMRRRHFGYADPRHAVVSLFNKGDYAFNSQVHHGTPAERVRAFLIGTELRLQSLEFSEVIRELKNVIVAIFPSSGPPVSQLSGVMGCSLTGAIEEASRPSKDKKDEIGNIDDFLIGKKSNKLRKDDINSNRNQINNLDKFLLER